MVHVGSAPGAAAHAVEQRTLPFVLLCESGTVTVYKQPWAAKSKAERDVPMEGHSLFSACLLQAKGVFHPYS